MGKERLNMKGTLQLIHYNGLNTHVLLEWTNLVGCVGIKQQEKTAVLFEAFYAGKHYRLCAYVICTDHNEYFDRRVKIFKESL